MRFTTKLLWGTLAAGAYYLYKNRNKFTDKSDEENVVHYLETVQQPPAAETTEAEVAKPPVKKPRAKKTPSETPES